ncbi:MAG: iron chaperone [Bryobacteraceae bacterium]
MRKAKSDERDPAAKSEAGPAAVDAYLDGVPEPARSTLRTLRAMIRAASPAEATEAISYGMPAFKYKGGLVGYAAFAKHCSFFPMSPAVIDAFEDELAKYETSKGTIRFSMEKPLPAALVKKLVKARVAENEATKRR